MNAGHLLIFAFIPSLLADPRLPARLSDLHIYSDLASGQVSTNYEPYSVNVSFWSDGADKERWFRLPPDTKIKYHPNGPWEFPPGTMFVKEFQKPTNGASHRIETRVLYLDAPSQITGATYRWNSDQSDAQLVESTQVLTDDSNPTKGKGWFLPGPQDCRVCHTPVNGGVLGLNTRQLNLTLTDGSNQLVSLAQYMDVVPRDIASCSKLPRIDDRFKMTSATNEILRITITNTPRF